MAAAAALNDAGAARAVAAERSLLAALGGGCNVPLGAYAVPEGRELWLRAVVGRPDGSALIRADGRGSDAAGLGQRVADELRARGAGELLQG
jgi:hydroxymethylbilane synthase